MRIRAKISFMALERRLTVVELLIETILKSYQEIQRMGIYPMETYEQEIRQNSTFQGLIKGEIKGFFRNIIQFNIDNVRGTFVEDRMNQAQKEFEAGTVQVIKNGRKTEVMINNEKNECKV